MFPRKSQSTNDLKVLPALSLVIYLKVLFLSYLSFATNDDFSVLSTVFTCFGTLQPIQKLSQPAQLTLLFRSVRRQYVPHQSIWVSVLVL
jgi:hypothetical protein